MNENISSLVEKLRRFTLTDEEQAKLRKLIKAIKRSPTGLNATIERQFEEIIKKYFLEKNN